MDDKYLDKVSENIKKTGFVLEYEITKKMNDLGWNTINNRYYVDDIDSTQKEIDLIAYKSYEITDVRYYTVLIISCKKSEENNWAFLTKELYEKDPNFNFHPISHWTNDTYLKFMLEKEKWEDGIVEQLKNNDTLKAIYGLKKQIFAFQEICKNKSTAKNDRNIFASISSLIKAQGYEKKSLDHRVKVNSYYNFNLLSVADTKFIDIHFDNGNISSEQINLINFLNRFIVWNESDFYRINFVTYNNFDELISHYCELHEWNVGYYSYLRKKFFDELLVDQDKLDFQFKKSINLLIKLIGNEFSRNAKREIKIEDFSQVTFEKKEGQITIRMDLRFDSDCMDILNSNKAIQYRTKVWLKRDFNFQGKFVYDYDLLF